MKKIFAVFLMLSFSAFGESTDGSFFKCEKGQCQSEKCDKALVVKKLNHVPLVACKKVLKINPKTKIFEFAFYELEINSLLPAKSNDECAVENPGCGNLNPKITIWLK